VGHGALLLRARDVSSMVRTDPIRVTGDDHHPPLAIRRRTGPPAPADADPPARDRRCQNTPAPGDAGPAAASAPVGAPGAPVRPAPGRCAPVGPVLPAGWRRPPPATGS